MKPVSSHPCVAQLPMLAGNYNGCNLKKAVEPVHAANV